MATNPALVTELQNLLSTRALNPTPAWLGTFISSTRPNTPIVALEKTALFRLLASDITQTLQASGTSTFPADIHNGTIREQRLPGPIVVQVMDIEDMSQSRWSQVEQFEAYERGEYTKGREVIRIAEEPEDGGVGGTGQTQSAGHRAQGGQGQPGQQKSMGPHKLLLQDGKGVTVYGLELEKVEKIGLDMNIGAKLVLRNVLVTRGVAMLEPKTVEVLGGKIDDLFKGWKDGRKDRLKAAAGITDRPQT